MPFTPIMRFVLYTNTLSAHQIPLAREIVARVGADNFRYIYTSKNGQKLQESNATYGWIRYAPDGNQEDWLANADVMLVGGIRPIDLMERRLANGKMTLYMSERWFKPIHVIGQVYVPGWLRLIFPNYRRMAKRFTRLFENRTYRFLPIGPWSLKDMRLVCHVMGAKFPDKHVIRWGDYVEAGKSSVVSDQSLVDEAPTTTDNRQSAIKVLWVGRLLKWKRVDTIIRAICELSTCPTRLKISMDIYGTGPEEIHLKKMAMKCGDAVKFYPPVSIAEVRKLMREHDVYVLASNACEGWGAVVNEALEEGMKVIGTYEAGASAAILPESNLFYAGDWRSLVDRLSNTIPYVPIGDWSAKRAVERLFQELDI